MGIVLLELRISGQLRKDKAAALSEELRKDAATVKCMFK